MLTSQLILKVLMWIYTSLRLRVSASIHLLFLLASSGFSLKRESASSSRQSDESAAIFIIWWEKACLCCSKRKKGTRRCIVCIIYGEEKIMLRQEPRARTSKRNFRKNWKKGKQFPWGVKLTDDDITWRAIRKLRRGEVFLIWKFSARRRQRRGKRTDHCSRI